MFIKCMRIKYNSTCESGLIIHNTGTFFLENVFLITPYNSGICCITENFTVINKIILYKQT